MQKLASFWCGKALGPVELTSIRSFLHHGDQITVYSPVRLELPEGAIWRDASEIMPSEKIIVDRKTGSPALHADLFRYAMLNQTDEIWVDLDIVALRPFDIKSEWVFGYECEKRVNNAVLRMPKHAETLRLLSQFHAGSRGIPPMVTGMRKAKYWLRSQVQDLTIDKWPWGSVGPQALTRFLHETGEIQHAMPRSAFYALSSAQVGSFLEPGALSMSDLPDDAFGVHLWAKELRQELKDKYNGEIPQGSFLAQLIDRYNT